MLRLPRRLYRERYPNRDIPEEITTDYMLFIVSIPQTMGAGTVTERFF